MNDYISREAAINACCMACGIDNFGAKELDICRNTCEDVQAIMSVPAADVRPVVRAEWEWNEHYGLYGCSNCHNSFVDKEWVKQGKWGYCPSCGADMQSVDGDET